MHEDEPGWFYVGNGLLRFKDGDTWTDQYHELDKPKADPVEKNETSAPQVFLPEPSRLGKRIVLLGSAAVMVILVAVGVYFVALRPLPTSVTWAPSVTGIAPGGYLTVSGVVTPAEQGRQILFESASGAQGPWQRMPQAAISDSRGQFAITLKPPLSSSIVMRAVVDPQGRQVAATGATKTLSLLALSKARLQGAGVRPAHTPLTFVVTSTPPKAGRTVSIEQSRDNRRWAPVGTSAKTTADGTSVMILPGAAAGVWSYRAVVSQDDKFATAVSPVIRARVMDFKAPAATYLRIINVWNVAKFSFLNVHGTANAKGEVPLNLRVAAGTFSTACNKEVSRLAAYNSWPSSIRPLITRLTAQKVVMAQTLHQLSATKSARPWNVLMIRSVMADNEGRRISGLIRAALGLPPQATINRVPEVV